MQQLLALPDSTGIWKTVVTFPFRFVGCQLLRSEAKLLPYLHALSTFGGAGKFSLWPKCCQTLKNPRSELQRHLGWFKWEPEAALWMLGLYATWVGWTVPAALRLPARSRRPHGGGLQTAHLGKTSVAQRTVTCALTPLLSPMQGARRSIVQPPLDSACSCSMAGALI